MRKNCSLSVNNENFVTKRGELLLDAALVNGVDIPHDCRSGHCGTCQVRVLDGLTIGGECGTNGMVRACQARVLTDLEVVVETVPEVVTTRAIVTGVKPLASEIVEVRLHLAKPVVYLPGQYYKVQFRGFPARCFSPTLPMASSNERDTVRFHIRQVPEGRVSSVIGSQINNGHNVKIHGPYGAAYLRSGQSNRLILVSSGTGFAPIWAIAKTALTENPMRPIIVILGGKNIDALYMAPAARYLSQYRNVRIAVTVNELPEGGSRQIRKGYPTDHMPALTADDIVYACGAPPMVEAVRTKAAAAGAMFYADPFTPQTDDSEDGILSQMFNRIGDFRLPMHLLGAPVQASRLERPK